MKNFIKTSPFLSTFFGFLILCGFISYWASNRPNFEIRWDRNVPSTHTVEELSAALEDLSIWPVFHHSLKEAFVLEDPTQNQTQGSKILKNGSTLLYKIEPPTRPWKRFDMQGLITEHVPGKKLSLKLTDDSTQRLTRLFDTFDWSIEILPASEDLKARGYHSVIRGETHARTAHWRGRLFGTVSPNILMNQVYYVDLVKLGTLSRQVEAAKENLAPSYQ
jgi:hypothetical protein